MIRALALIACLGLSGCVTGTNGQSTITLAQAQAEAKVVLSAVTMGVQAYEAATSIDPDTKGKIDLALAGLTVAVNAFEGLSGQVNYATAAQAVATTAQGVVAVIPDMPASTRAAIQAGLTVVQAIIPLLPQPMKT